MFRRCTAVRVLLAAGLLASFAACDSARPWDDFRLPPTASASAGAAPSAISPHARPAVMIVGRFDNPASASVPWRDIGSGMSDALTRSLLTHGRFDVRMNPELATKFQPLITSSRGNQQAELDKLRKQYPTVDYVLLGKVTDFHHTADLASGVQRSRWLFGKSNDAIVAIRFHIVDLNARQVVAVDHLYGSASAPDTPAKELYRGLSIDSYLFWSTPLGKAATRAIEVTRDHLAKLVPTRMGDIRVSRLLEMRKIEVAAGEDWGLQRGQEFFIAARSPGATTALPVHDPDTLLPLKATIDRVGRNESTAWLSGRRPIEVEIRDMLLIRELPPAAPLSTASAGG